MFLCTSAKERSVQVQQYQKQDATEKISVDATQGEEM